VEVLFCWWLRLWKSVSGAALKPFSQRLVQTRRRPWVARRHQAFERTRDRNVGVELLVPYEDVQTLDLLDQQHDRPSRRCNLCTRVVLKPAAPSTQHLQLLGVESAIVHVASVQLSVHGFHLTTERFTTGASSTPSVSALG